MLCASGEEGFSSGSMKIYVLGARGVLFHSWLLSLSLSCNTLPSRIDLNQISPSLLLISLPQISGKAASSRLQVLITGPNTTARHQGVSPQDQGLQWAKESVSSGPIQLKLCQFPIRCSHEEEAARAIRPVYQLERRSVRTEDPTAQGGALRHLDQGGLGGLPEN